MTKALEISLPAYTARIYVLTPAEIVAGGLYEAVLSVHCGATERRLGFRSSSARFASYVQASAWIQQMIERAEGKL